MRSQATALFKKPKRKQLLEGLAKTHNDTQSRILVAGLLGFSRCSPAEQKLWLDAVDEKDE